MVDIADHHTIIEHLVNNIITKDEKERIVKNQRANPLIFLSGPSFSLIYSLTNVEERKRVKANSADEASQVEKAVKAIDDRQLVKAFKGVEWA